MMAWDREGNIVVAACVNDRLQIIRLSDGAVLRTIGSKGSGDDQFYLPTDVAFGFGGRIIVLDAYRVQVLRYSDGSHVRTIGSQGSGNGQFDRPCADLLDCQGRIIVSDSYNHRIQVLE